MIKKKCHIMRSKRAEKNVGRRGAEQKTNYFQLLLVYVIRSSEKSANKRFGFRITTNKT